MVQGGLGRKLARCEWDESLKEPPSIPYGPGHWIYYRLNHHAVPIDLLHNITRRQDHSSGDKHRVFS